MKYTVILSMIALVVLAVPTLGDPAKVRVADTPGRQGDGGPFSITVIQGPLSYVGDNSTVTIPVGGQFLSFCIERHEPISLPGDYWVEINTGAVAGGVGGDPDPLDTRTAALYRQWRAGPLASNPVYQLAMWSLEQEAVFDGGVDNRWEDTASGNALRPAYQVGEAPVTNLIATVGNPPDLGNVRVMTLWRNWTLADGFYGYAQDQLVVPVPAAVLLGMFGLTAAGLKLRKFV